MARSSRWGGDRSYLQTANKRVCLLVQVESRQALETIEEIAATEGVDGVFVGPSACARMDGENEMLEVAGVRVSPHHYINGERVASAETFELLKSNEIKVL